MGPQILIPISLFLMIFGIVYLIYSTRNRERLALIEKGVDASIFMKGKNSNTPIWKVLVLNFAFLLIGSGIGIFVALLITTYTSLQDGAVYPATIFTIAGLGLLIGFNKSKDLDKD
ncbi:hypothetical protein LNQ49_13105 [Flavobacterium sp. F-65]|jgi:type III secretory pathway component EscS|uniref:DUF6249 domain-containing protein n=1 Tax=Flavobacterium pisciphilum TaxID=2893755 RepID=A0ABS8MV50_9FLAO|nr:DUF6249 domain-containing protein [Flavobacterium sp. F-65]MCC9072523.1 hypothetical protein [Flavobacterium sp. F-65]